MNSNGLCRCCLTQPADKDLQSFYVRSDKDGKNEYIHYGDMLEECYGVKLSLEERDCDNGICDACIDRLRDARDFKHQVLHCLEEFQLKLFNNSDNNVELQKMSDENSDTEDNGIYIFLEPKEELSEIEDLEDKLVENDRLEIELRKSCKNRAVKEKPTVLDKKNGQDPGSTFTLTYAKDGTQSYTCNICQKAYRTRNNFYQHYKHVHLRQRPKLRSCHLCNVKVPGYMRAFHMEEHGLPAPSCGACGKKFAYPFQVLQHQKFYHMGEAKYHCEKCNLKFKYPGKYNHHQIKHRNEKAYKCDLCNKTFKWKSGLNTHMLMHNNIRRHICHICQDAFIQLSSLKYHLMKKHP